MPGGDGDVERARRGRRAGSTPGGRSARARGGGCRALPRRARARSGRGSRRRPSARCRAASKPTTQMPRALSASMACTTLPMRATFTCSSAARGGAAHRLREPGAVAVGQQHAVRARRLHRAQDRAEVARVLDAVEHHDQRGRARARPAACRRVTTGLAETTAIRPWCGTPPAMRSRVSRASKRSGMPRWPARADRVGDARVAQALDDEQAVEVAACPRRAPPARG